MHSAFDRNLGPVPLLDPLSYPGRLLDRAALLDGERLVDVGMGEIDVLLGARRVAPLSGRTPVLAVGSNGAPAQVRYKFAAAGVSCVVPMAPTLVEGVSVGVSAHVSPAGYVAAAPVMGDGGSSTLVLSWLDEAQLAVMDASEGRNYRRVPVPVPVPVSGLDAQMYVSAHGLLARDGVPRAARPQGELISELLAGSAALRGRFGESPESWVRVASADEGARRYAGRVFAEEGWVRESEPYG
ncbi:hypothetical protein GCM10009801_21060 [Streptomyces albiaxialis]|uniref:Uncharacterized protein n=1 Tax=Streptomyces albiaxialis TaxID=329523 RepID=A0ABN2VRN2_9ACTN